MLDVRRDLKTICVATAYYLGDEYIEDLFGGVVSLHEFANYVYFEYCAATFLNRQEKKSVNQHCIQFEKQLPTDFKDPQLTNLSEEDIDYLFSFAKGDALSRGISRSVKQMLEHRAVPDRKNVDISSIRNALADLKEFQISGKGGRLHEMPMTKGYFYHALTDSEIGNERGQIHKWMALSRSAPKKYLKFYLKLYRFIRLFMIGKYTPDASDDELDSYISQAINLCKLEDRNKFNSILNFADKIVYEDSDYFKKYKHRQPFRDSVIPPFFFCTVAPWEENLQCPNKTLIDVLGHFGYLIGLIDHSFACPSPVLYYNQYLDYFLKATDEDKKIEEYRYYAILALAEFIRLKISSKEISVIYSNQKFAWFIHNLYNIFDIYHAQCSKDVEQILTYDVVKRIRLIVSDMLPQKKQVSSEPAAIIPPS